MSTTKLTKFLYAVDLHWGYERVSGHKKPLHDLKAINAMLQFAKDWKPDVVILGGDVVDCGAISHHNHGKPGATEGLKLVSDMAECSAQVIKPLEALSSVSQLVYIEGNHEAWLKQFTDLHPTLEGIVDLQALLKLDRWKLVAQGGQFDLGKLTFLHGDTLSGADIVAKNAVVNYERNVRFGHFHTAQTYTKNSPSEYKNAKTGVAVPCLCGKAPQYGKSKPNKWVQGFQFGVVGEGGNFSDWTQVIVDGKFIGCNGKVYKG